jgi:hypothetical protein
MLMLARDRETNAEGARKRTDSIVCKKQHDPIADWWIQCSDEEGNEGESSSVRLEACTESRGLDRRVLRAAAMCGFDHDGVQALSSSSIFSLISSGFVRDE